jgi:hypothetical protein
MTDPHLLIVAGTGRSGTSTFVGVLRRHGFHVPRPEVEADETNPRGFGEPQWVVDLHTRLLRRAGVQVADARPRAFEATQEIADSPAVRARVVDWLREHSESNPLLIVKDPRSLWFLRLWRSAAHDLGVKFSVVTMLRPPPETVGSRRAHYNEELKDPHGIASWLNLMTGTEHSTRGDARTFVRYQDLLEDWSHVVDEVWRRNGLPVARPAPGSDPNEFIDPALRRQRLGWEDLELPSRLEEMAVEADAALDTLVGADLHEPEPDAVLSRLDGVRHAYAEFYAESEAVAHSSIVAARQQARRPRSPQSQDAQAEASEGSALSRALSRLGRRPEQSGH